MKLTKKLLAVILATLMAITVLPFATTAADAAGKLPFTCEMVSNYEVKITTEKSAKILNISEDLTAQTVDDGFVINATEGEVGVGTIEMFVGYISYDVKIPHGYTTFVFDGDRLTVLAGSDTNYEVAGIDKQDNSYTLEPTTDPSGNDVYTNTDDYSINVNIKKKGGEYVFCGQSDDMSISVNKGATNDARLYLAGLDLKSQFTSPITVKKESTAKVYIHSFDGFENYLEDTEFNNADIYGPTEDGGDGSNMLAESAVIKGKTDSKIAFLGQGPLHIVSNAKNAVKGGKNGCVILERVDMDIASVKNGISADGDITITGATITASVVGDAITSEEYINIVTCKLKLVGGQTAIQSSGFISIDSDYRDWHETTISISDCVEGMEGQNITINGGIIDISCSDDGLNASGGDQDNDITVNDGKITINAGGDGIDSNGSINLLGGQLIVVSAEPESEDCPLDSDTDDLKINGAVVFAIGSKQHIVNPKYSQNFVTYQGEVVQEKSSLTVNVLNSEGEIIDNTKVFGKKFDYVLYSAPFSTADCTFGFDDAPRVYNELIADAEKLEQKIDYIGRYISTRQQIDYIHLASLYQNASRLTQANVSNYDLLADNHNRYYFSKNGGVIEFYYGDLNNDNKVASTDALIALQAATSKNELSLENSIKANVDGVSGVNATDALLILQMAVQKIPFFPIETID